MTEDEAKTKWCPFARCVGGHRKADGSADINLPTTPPFNRIATDGGTVVAAAALCIATACMAWRTTLTAKATLRAEALRREGKSLMPSGADLTGYCGLAGVPR